jgi:hypothetical protein
MCKWIAVCLCSLLVSLLAVHDAYAQQSVPDEVEDIAIDISIPAQAVVGHARIEFAISVQNTHPRNPVTFTALIVVAPGLAGPETWSAEVTPLADSDQGRVYRWTTTVAARRTVILRAVSSTGETVGVQPALDVRLLSATDELHSTRTIELVQGSGRPRGSMSLTDIGGDFCQLEEVCLLLLQVRSPTIQSFRGTPLQAVGCEFLGFGGQFTVDTDRVTETLFWFVTRSQGRYGEGCTVSTQITMGSRTFPAVYNETRLVYLPAIGGSTAAGQ